MPHSFPATRTALIVLFLLSLCAPLRAQHDTRGTAFWVTFMSSWGGGENQETPDMRLYLSSEVPTVARVIYFGGADTMIVPLPRARTAVEVDITSRFGPDVELGLGEEFSPKGVQIIADDEITCYGVTIRNLSADAFVALPEDVLTNAYIVLAYPNGFIRGGSAYYDQPSQFAIVATEDGTTVRIDPSAQLVGRAQATYTITLDRGEVYNGQAVTGRLQDVSGTEIKSNKPVAVFSGVRRASIPVRIGLYRDFLVEQMTPLETWGKDAIITPHYPIRPQSTDTAVVRVLAAFDNTRWQIDGVEQPPLMSAASVEIPLLRSMFITASDPILVAQYEHSVNAGGGNALGDPFMMLIPPVEQFDRSYVFQAVSHPEFVSDAHFVNVVIPSVATGSLRLDGAPVVATWRPTPKAGYSFAQINVTPGSHNIDADSAFGLYSYGFGRATSYGYSGGMLFRRLVHDFEPPGLEPTGICLGMDGVASDARITDSGIDSLYALPSSRNVAVRIDPFTPGADTVRYRATLVDPYQDGIVAMKVVDSAGRSRTMSNPIAGFTVRTVGMAANTALALDTLRLLNRADTCIDITIENYGRFPQTISSLVLDPPVPGAGYRTALPLVIAPGERATLRLCAAGWADTVLSTRLVIVGDCLDRAVAELPIISGIDTTPPSISSSDAACRGTVLLTFTDRSAVNSTISSVTFDSLFNARVVRQGDFPASVVETELEPIDPRRDLVYQVRVIDGSGNETVRRDTIGGFTLAMLDDARDSVAIRFERDLRLERIIAGDGRCDSVVLHNYGGRTLTLTTLRFAGNRGFSVPPSQLPLAIPPYGDRTLLVCVEADGNGILNDTLLLADACGRSELVVLRVAVPPVLTQDGCNSVISVMTVGASKRTFIATPFPNPSRGTIVTVDLGLASDGAVTLELVDAGGTTVNTVLDHASMRAGLHRVAFDVASLDNGTYFCRLRTDGGSHATGRLVVQR